MSKTKLIPNKSLIINFLPVWLLIALTGLDFLSHIPLGGDYSNRSLDSNLWRNNFIITNAVFYAIAIWAIAKLILNPKYLKSLLNPILLSFLAYCVVVALSISFNWPFKLPGWDTSQTYPTAMVFRLFAFFLAVGVMYASVESSIHNSTPDSTPDSTHSVKGTVGEARANPASQYISRLWNIILAFFAIRICLVWIQSLMLKFPSNLANPTTDTQAFLSKQLELLFDGRLFYPVRAQGLEFPFLYGPLNANVNATLAVILLCTALIRLLNARKNHLSIYHSLVWVILGSIALFTIVFTHSSAALVLVLLAIPVILLLNKRADVIATALFIIAAIGLFFDDPIQKTITDYVGRGENVIERVTDLGGRRYIWQKAISHVQDKPMFGHGYETNRFVIGRALKDVPPYNDPEELHAHNTYISVLVENGIVGLVPLLLGVLMLWYVCINKVKLASEHPKLSTLSQEMLILLLIMSFSSLVYIGFFNSVLIIYRWLMFIPLLLFAMLPVTTLPITTSPVSTSPVTSESTEAITQNKTASNS